MSSFKVFIFVAVAITGYAVAAPKPISLDEVGRKIHDFGQKALPAVRGVCGFVSGYQGYPPAYPAYPQGYPQGYPQYPPQGYYPQMPRYPQYTPNYGPPQPNFPRGGNPSVATEQDDLNGVNSAGDTQYVVPPQIQDVFKNFNKLPKVNIKDIQDNKLDQGVPAED